MNPEPLTLNLGQVVWTRGVWERVAEDEKFAEHVFVSALRHRGCDWGDVCEEDKGANAHALVEGSRILSSYGKDTDQHIWIITEADRSVTTVLFPSEY
jgi:hypothetical protein